jgi:hypothetical protein
MSSNTKTSSNGIGFGTILFCIFLVLKLTHVIDWSWLWVTAPLWIPLAIVGIVLVVAGFLWAAGGFFEWVSKS